MNWTDTLVILSIGGSTAALVGAVLRALAHLLLHVLVVDEQMQASAMDRLLADSGYCSSRTVGPARMPADGYHALSLHGSGRGLVLAHRARQRPAPRHGAPRTHYRIYALGRATAAALHQSLMGNAAHIAVCYVYAPAPWRTSSVSLRVPPPGVPLPWQEDAVRALVDAFQRHGRASMLVCGPSGAGKSTLGELVAAELQQRLRTAPVVIKNLDLTLPGLLLEDAYDTPSPDAPVVLHLDEFDAMVDHAERGSLLQQQQHAGSSGSSAREATALADTPTSLLSIMDRLNRAPAHIVIATSNRGSSEMNSSPYARYVRRGRLDWHAAVIAPLDRPDSKSALARVRPAPA